MKSTFVLLAIVSVAATSSADGITVSALGVEH